MSLNNKVILWYGTLLSALLFSLSFWASNSVGFLVIVSFIILLFATRKNIHSVRQAFLLGLSWGIIVYGLHFIWLFYLFKIKSNASIIVSLLLYLFIAFYFSLTSGVWFIFWRLAPVSSTVLYFYFLDYVSLSWVGSLHGYPFISPLIPLAHYQTVLKALSFCSLFFVTSGEHYVGTDVSRFIFIKPTVNTQSPFEAGLQLYRTIDQQLFKKKYDNNVIFISPESSFPYPINQCNDIVSLLGSRISKQAKVFLGCHYINNHGELLQAVCWLEDGCIKNIHTKKHLIPFVEKMPPLFKKCSILRDLFLKGLKEFSPDCLSDKTDFFYDENSDIIIPQICSEFFFQSKRADFIPFVYKQNAKNVTIFLFVNDSWFIEYFRKLQEQLVRIKSALVGIPVLYVGHFGYKIISINKVE